MTDDEANRELLADLTDAFGQGDGAIVVILRGGAVDPHHLLLRSTLVSPVAMFAAAEYLLEILISRCEAITDGSAAGMLPHLRDALRSYQAAAVSRADEIAARAAGLAVGNA